MERDEILTPEQQMYTDVRMICADIVGADHVYDYLPGTVPYPFIVLGDQTSQNALYHKDYYNKDTQLVVHLWHDDWKERGRITGIIGEIEHAVIAKYNTGGAGINHTIMPDTSTGNTLLHAEMELDLRL